MKRRFGRRRRSGGGDDGSSAIDAGWLQKITEAGLVPTSALEAIEDAEVPPSLALLAKGRSEDGGEILVAFSPRDAGDALLGLVAYRRAAAAGPADEPGAGEGPPAGPAGRTRAYVVSRWSIAARRRLALVGELDVSVEPVEAGRLLEGPGVAPEPAPQPKALPPAQVGAGLADPAARELFARALASLAGLAAKHAGGVRGTDAGVELVLVARRVARVSVRDEQVFLEVFENRTAPQRLSSESLSEAFDQLEGQLRKRIRDAKVARSEDGLRARAQTGLVASLGLRSVVAFPLGGSDVELIDAIGVDAEGQVVVIAVREALELHAIGPILDAWAQLQPSVPALLGGALPPVRLDRAPRLVIAAQTSSGAAIRVLEGLTLALTRLDVQTGRDGSVALVAAGSAPASAPAVGDGRERGGRRRGRNRRGPRRQRGDRDGLDDDLPEEDEGPVDAASGAEPEPREDDSDGPPSGPRRSRNRGRGRRGSRGDSDRGGDRGGERGGERDDSGGRRDARNGNGRDRGSADAGEDVGDEGEDRPRFAELSSFDLDDSFGLSDGNDGGARRGRGRGRRRGRGRNRRDGGGEEEDSEGPAPEVRAEAERPGLAEPEDVDPEDDGTVDEEDLALAEAPEPEEDPEPLRQERPRKAAVLAHADRHSIAAAMLLAREARQVEGVWVYPQEELMTFFRSVAIDLRDDVTIFVVGFQASPARDAIQAASLYAGRIEWYDTQEWPPEDLARLKGLLGDDFVDVRPHLESPLPLVLPRCSRRSRFSDKLVDLLAARFSEHDFQRWGRLWWWRLADIASRPGEHKNALQPLLTGRPSDLTTEASRAETPPPPPEVAFVGSRDFRIVHFGGYGMVVVEVPPELDLAMAGRIARERYRAHLSLAIDRRRGLAMLGTNDGLTPRPMAVTAMAEHLGQKLAWVDLLPGDDHVARVHIAALDAHPERLEAVVSEIGMGRSILEG